ncbi:MAG: DUF2924 domain-containing protein [Parvibaculum sp.]
MRPPSTEPEALPDKATLRQRWTKLFGCAPPPRLRSEFLHLAVEWHRQAKQLGGLQRADREAMSALVQTMKQGSKPKVPAMRDDLQPGTVLMREWNERHYEVLVTEEGFLFRDKTWKSLSQIAREITGARWNGPAFFGLRSKRKTVTA